MKNLLVLKKKQLLTMLIQLCLLLILRILIFLLGLRNMLKFQLWLIRVILEHLDLLNKLKLNLVLQWLKIFCLKYMICPSILSNKRSLTIATLGSTLICLEGLGALILLLLTTVEALACSLILTGKGGFSI